MKDVTEYRAVFREVLGGIILEDMSQTYADIHGLSASDKGGFVEDVLPREDADRVKYYLGSYRGTVFSQSYIKSTENHGIWKVSARIEHPAAVFSGIRLDYPDDGKALFCSERRMLSDEVVVAALKNGRSFPVYKSSNAEEAAAAAGESVISLLGRLQGHMEQCRKTEMCKRLCIAARKEGTYLRIQLIPFSVGSDRLVMLKLSGISFDCGRSAQALTDAYLLGVCVIDMCGEGDDFFYDINPYMCRLLASGEISKQEIVSSYPFCSALSQGATRFGIVSLGSGKYFIGAVPVYGSDGCRMTVFMIRSDSSQMVDDSCFELLTPREQNVVRLALEGMSSKSIGKALSISEGTVKRELFTSCRKLKVKGKLGMLLKMYHLN